MLTKSVIDPFDGRTIARAFARREVDNIRIGGATINEERVGPQVRRVHDRESSSGKVDIIL